MWELLREPFVELCPTVLVLASEVAAVTRHPKTTLWTAVYLKGAGGEYVLVDRPMVEVVQVLEDARTGGTSPPS